MAENKKKNEALELEEAITKSEAFVLKYKKQLIGGISAVILLIAGILCYQNYYAQPREDKASAAMAKAEENFRNNEYELALNGNEGVAGFTQIMKDYSGTDAATIAKVYAGECYAQLGQYKEAVSMLEGFDKGDQMISPAILGTLGNCYAQLGQMEKAASTLMNAAKKADNITLSPVFLIQAGEIFESLGKKEDARKAYQQIKDKYFQSMQYSEVEKYLERVK